MFKKLLLAISCLTILTLVACGYDGDYDATPMMLADSLAESEYIGIVTLPGDLTNESSYFTIEIATNELIEEITADEHWYLFDFSQATGGFITEGITLLLTFNEPISNFSLTEITSENEWNELHTISATSIEDGPVGRFMSGMQILITNFPPTNQLAFFSFGLPYESFQQYYYFTVDQMHGLQVLPRSTALQFPYFDFLRVEFTDNVIVENDDSDFDDIEFDLDGQFSMPMIDPIAWLTIDRMEPYIGEDQLIDVQNTIQHYFSIHHLDFIQMVNYEMVWFSRPMAELNRMYLPQGDFLLLLPQIPLLNIEILSLEATDGDFQMNFSIVDRFSVAEGMLVGEGLVIYNYLSVGSIPLSGITFTNEFGSRMYYLIFQDQSDEFPPYRLIPFVPYRG